MSAEAGETHALALALCRKTLILSDDRVCRRRASDLGLEVVGTLGILKYGKKLGVVQALKPLLLELRSKGRYFSDQLLDSVLHQVGE